jgi:hypothetical protein
MTEKRITIRLSPELHQHATRAAAFKKLSLNEYMVHLLKETLLPEPPKTREITDEEWEKISNDF